MDYAIPILISHENEDFRFHLREMLTKHGFFHVIEATNVNEMELFLEQESKFFALVHSELATPDVLKKLLSGSNGYLFITQPESSKTMDLAVQMGVSHLLSFPFSSQHLVEKIMKFQ